MLNRVDNKILLTNNQILFQAPEENSFTFEIETLSSNTVFTLPTHSSSYVYNYGVNWGDGSGWSQVTTYNSPNITHTYVNTGLYNIKLTGYCEYFAVNNDETTRKKSLYRRISSNDYVLGFKGDLGLKVLNFNGCNNLYGEIPIGISNLKNLVSVSALFTNTSIGVNNLTSKTPTHSIPVTMFKNCNKITTMTNLVFNCTGLTGWIPPDLFKYSPSITTLTSVFYGCTNLNGPIPSGLFDALPDLNVLTQAFYMCYSLTGAIPTNLFYYNTGVTSYYRTFFQCRNLILPPTLFNEPAVKAKVIDFRGFMSVTSQTYKFTVPSGFQPIWSWTYTSGLQTSGTTDAFTNQGTTADTTSIIGWAYANGTPIPATWP